MCSHVGRGILSHLTRTVSINPYLSSARHIPPCVRLYTSVSSASHLHRAAPRQHSDKHATDVPYLREDVLPDDPVVQRLFKGLVEGKRSMLAESITLIESMHPRKQAQAQLLLSKMMEQAKTVTKETHKNISSFRIGEIALPRLIGFIYICDYDHYIL